MNTLAKKLSLNPRNYGFKNIRKNQFEKFLSENNAEETEIYNGTAYRIDGIYKVIKRNNASRPSYWATVEKVYNVEIWTIYGWETISTSTFRHEAKGDLDIYRRKDPLHRYRIKLSYDLK